MPTIPTDWDKLAEDTYRDAFDKWYGEEEEVEELPFDMAFDEGDREGAYVIAYEKGERVANMQITWAISAVLNDERIKTKEDALEFIRRRAKGKLFNEIKAEFIAEGRYDI